MRLSALAGILFLLNVYICRELFGIEFLNTLSSNDGLFIAISRFYKEHGTGGGWFPWLNAGMPIENAYQPLLPAFSALVSIVSGWPIGRAMHFVLALFYCLGPVALFWLVYEWSESLAAALVAGLAYSITSPAELLVPVLRLHSHGQWGALRLYNLVHYAEDPHNVALALVPLALMFVYRAAISPNPRRIAGAVISCACVVLSNAFGAIDLAIGCACIVLALNRGWITVPLTGIAAYLLASPWLPPSLIDRMRHDQWGARGVFTSGSRSALGVLAVIAIFVLLWFAGRRIRSTFGRFAILFAFGMCVIPLAFFWFDLTLVPQGSRYQLELELGLCLLFGWIVGQAIPSLRIRQALFALAILGALWQTVQYRRFAKDLIQPVDIAQTIEYKSDLWMARNLPEGRRMVSGDGEYYYNVFSDTPEMSGAHEPTAPNFEQLIAIFTIFTGQNAGDRDAEYSLLWLKAFGNEAIYVPGEKSREYYHPIAHPHKFDGILPVLWHAEDDTIYQVPLRSRSLAHVIPNSAVVSRAPVHGLDVDPLRPYVAALDSSAFPLADMRWDGTARAVIHTSAQRGQVISVQENYASGWRAWIGDRRIPVRKDGIGLMVLDPDCNGACGIRLEYGPTTEAWICRILSAIVTIGLLGAVFYWHEAKKFPEPRLRPRMEQKS